MIQYAYIMSNTIPLFFFLLKKLFRKLAPIRPAMTKYRIWMRFSMNTILYPPLVKECEPDRFHNH